MTGTPVAEQLALPPEYGTPTRLLDWAVVSDRLAAARTYWLATVRPDGRPHVVPLDGVWLDDRWFFGGSPSTVKHRNLLANPRVALHLEDGLAATVVEGRCEVVRATAAEAARLSAAGKAKYGYGQPASTYRAGVWRLTPERVLAWTQLHVDATRFVF